MNGLIRTPWFTAIMLSAVYACSQLDRQIMGILLEPIKKDLGASDAQMGLLAGLSFALFYTFMAMPIAAIADRGYRKNIIAASLVVWSLMTALCGLTVNYLQMSFARIGVAAGEAGSTPASISIISSLFDAKRRATAIAVFVFGANVGSFIALMGGGLLLEAYGWRRTFFILGIPGVLLGILVYFLVPEPEKPAEARERLGFKRAVSFMASNPAIRHILFGQSVAAMLSYGFGLWIPTFLARSHGLTPSQIGITLALVVGIAGGVGTLLSGRVSDAFGRRDDRWRAWSIAVSKIIPIPLLLGFLLVDSPYLAIALYVVPAVLSIYYLAPSAAIIQHLVDERMRAFAAAVGMFLLNLIGMGLGPQGVGLLSDLLSSTFGTDSLRYAMCIFVSVNIWAAFHYWRAGQFLGRAKSPAGPN